jgi:drebrin-like protein
LYDYNQGQEGDLIFYAGNIITILDESDPSGWWQGELNGATGSK